MINDNLLNVSGDVLESSLADTLNPSIIGGVTKGGNETFYNTVKYSNNNGQGTTTTTSSGGGSYVSPEMIESSIAITTSLLAGLKNKRAGDICKKPLLPESGLNHGKWNSYRDCLRSEEKKRQDAIDLAQSQLEQQQLELINAGGKIDGNGDKILGMSKPVFWVGVGVLTLVAGFITYKVIKSKSLSK